MSWTAHLQIRKGLARLTTYQAIDRPGSIRCEIGYRALAALAVNYETPAVQFT